MPLTLNVGTSKKIGEANYGSRGASVSLELELDNALLGEPAKLRERIRALFGLVDQALAEELNGGPVAATPMPARNGTTESPAAPAGNGSGATNGRSRPATAAQVKALYAIARQQGLDLHAVVRERCHVERPDALTVQEASRVIDALKGTGRQPVLSS